MELFEVGDDGVGGAGVVQLLEDGEVVGESFVLFLEIGAAFEDEFEEGAA